MNLITLCFVLVALSVGASSKSVSDNPVSQIVEEKLEDKMTTVKSIDDNSTDEIDDDYNHRGLGSIVENLFSSANEMQGPAEGRTFALKRLQFMMMPMIYKMGVMMTLLMVLTVISLKGLAIGVILLVLKLGAIFGKFYASTQSHGPAYGWVPPQPPQPVHVHVHNSGGGQHHHPQPYSGWEASGPPEDEHYYYKG